MTQRIYIERGILEFAFPQLGTYIEQKIYKRVRAHSNIMRHTPGF